MTRARDKRQGEQEGMDERGKNERCLIYRGEGYLYVYGVWDGGKVDKTTTKQG